MEASIREPNIKHFVRLLQCASRYGDDLCMHATKDSWELAVTNSSKSAFCLFTLSPTFFSRFKPLGTVDQQRRGVKCKLYVKSVLGVLGKASSVNSVERVDLRILDPEGGLRVHTQAEDEEEEDDIRVAERSAQLEIKLVYHHGITKKHFLHLQSSDFLRAVVDPISMSSGFQISAKALRDWLDHFSIAFTSSTTANGMVKGDSQLAWRFSPNEVRVKNFENNASALSTEIKIDVAEFEDYEVMHDDGHVDLALPMREFKATLQLAEQFNMDLDIMFSESTQPLTMSSSYIGLDRYSNETQLFTISCIIATTTCETFASVPVAAPANGSRDQRSASVTVKTDPSQVPGSRRRDGFRSASRPRASLSMTAQPNTRAPSMVTVVGGGEGLLSQSRINEPLFMPGPSQGSVRMSQAEVLEMAGVTEDDLTALLDDAEEDEGDKQENERGNDDVPADWSEIDFKNIPPENQSTQRDAIAAAQMDETLAPSASTHRQRLFAQPLQPTSNRTQSTHEIGSHRQYAPPPSRSQGGQPLFNDSDIFGPNNGSRQGADSTRSRPSSQSRDLTPSDEEIGPDLPNPSQAGDHRFTTIFND